jgi:hypothetical protein
MVVFRKNLSIEKGEEVLFDDIRYFFFITNDWTTTSTSGKSSPRVVPVAEWTLSTTHRRPGYLGRH